MIIKYDYLQTINYNNNATQYTYTYKQLFMIVVAGTKHS